MSRQVRPLGDLQAANVWSVIEDAKGNLFVATGVAFAFATVGMEMAGASLSAAGGRFTARFMVLVTIEEVTEMASIAVFLCAVLDYANRTVGRVHCSFGPARLGN